MFGGAGHFIHEIKRRETFNDFALYDIDKNRWFDPIKERNDEVLSRFRITSANSHHIDDNVLFGNASEPPMKRYGHAAAILGCGLVIHGGINGEENVVITDAKEPQEFALFDF